MDKFTFSQFDWDETKRLSTLAKHSIDFRRIPEVFLGKSLIYPSPFQDEPRWLAIGLIDGVEITTVFTIRGEVCRIITARRARDYERAAYHARYS